MKKKMIARIVAIVLVLLMVIPFFTGLMGLITHGRTRSANDYIITDDIELIDLV